MSRDTVAPVVTRASVTNRRFTVARGSTPVSALARTPAGTTFRQTLSERATLSIKLEALVAGRRVGSRCVPSARRGRRCTLVRSAGTLRRRVARGAGRVAFTGRVGRTALRPGSYRATLTAVDAAGNRSRSVRVSFTVVRSAR